jgi:hypothetical protein
VKDYSTFIFESYSFDPEEGVVELTYSLDGDVHFTEKLTFQRDGLFPAGVDPELLDQALFALHLIGGVSYYKTCCPKKIEIRSGKLTKEQAEFWNIVYEKGLGEFFYKNEMDFEGLINFPAKAKKTPEPIEIEDFHDRVLVPIGGGKDSIVTIEMLRAAGMNCTLFRLGKHPLIEKAAEVTKLPLIGVERQLSPELFRLNEEGALNGHIPITAYLKFLSIVTSLLYGFDFVAMSSERSASEGNVEYKGKMINHQWSKSLEFEQMFQRYVHHFLTPDIDCFSLLRSMSELHIAQHFCAYPQYFECATSCNTNWRIVEEKPKERWCGTCPKCAFVFCQFAAFLPKKTLLKIFGKNLFEDESLIPLYKQLLGLEGFKPFECVGTPEETAAAMLLAVQQGEMEDTPVMQMFLLEKAENIQEVEKLVRDVLSPSDEHAVSARFLMRLDAHS